MGVEERNKGARVEVAVLSEESCVAQLVVNAIQSNAGTTGQCWKMYYGRRPFAMNMD